jgi:hypothetical protein
MGVPFGFSVGDIIAGIGMIMTSIEAFSDTRGATKDHKQLSDILTRLSESLELIRGIEVDPIQDARQRGYQAYCWTVSDMYRRLCVQYCKVQNHTAWSSAYCIEVESKTSSKEGAIGAVQEGGYRKVQKRIGTKI